MISSRKPFGSSSLQLQAAGTTDKVKGPFSSPGVELKDQQCMQLEDRIFKDLDEILRFLLDAGMPSDFDWERFFNDDRFTAEEVNPHITIATRAWQEKNVMSSHFDVKGATEELEEFLATTAMSTPKFYNDITLLLADPENDFPLEFNPERPSQVKVLERASREGFIRTVERKNGETVVPLERFDPQALKEVSPEDVELRDGATYIVVPRSEKSYENRFKSIEAWQKHQNSGDERMLVARAKEKLEKNHTNVRAWCKKRVTGPDGLSREVDAAAIADNCAIVVEHKNLMDYKGAVQLVDLVSFINAHKDSGEGTVSDFSGKLIIGALAGPFETSDPNNKKQMDALLHQNKCIKWYEEKSYGGDPCSPFQASGASCDAPAPSDSPGNGPTAPAAVPRRVGRLLAPMRGSAMLVHPRLANRVAGCRPSF
ncbi:hypothetical protein NADE_002214 [Nannochloris sp. 'desiccata']|nr:hypothetical protein NADE_002214 [Chlorella desiccata (nom. nud.)]